MFLFGCKELYIDNCTGFLQEVPENFDNGRTKVELTVISISRNFFAIGSECGALFLFNRNLNRTVKPLRTADCDSVTALQLYANDGENYLAVGRKSGQVIIMCLPSDRIRKIRQNIQDEIHQGQAITCVKWSPDGRRLYSVDIGGQVIATDVDFDNEIYSCVFVADLTCPIRNLDCTNETIFFCSQNQWMLIEARTMQLLKIGEENDERQIISSFLLDENPYLAFSDSKVVQMLPDGKIVFDCLAAKEMPNLPKLIVDGILTMESQNIFINTAEFDFKVAHYYQKNPICAALWSTEKICLVEMEKNQLFGFDLSKAYNDDLLNIISATIDEKSMDLYFLTRRNQVLRISKTKPIPELLLTKVVEPESTYSLMNSVFHVAQNSRSFFSKFSSIKELDKLKELRQNPKFAELQSRLSEAVIQVAAGAESGKTMANEFIEQIKNTPLYSDFDSTTKRYSRGTSEESKDDDDDSNDTETSNDLLTTSEPMKGELIVTRRRKTKIVQDTDRDALYGLETPDLIKKTPEEFVLTAESKVGHVGIMEVEEQMLQDILTGNFELPKIIPDPELVEKLTENGKLIEDNQSNESMKKENNQSFIPNERRISLMSNSTLKPEEIEQDQSLEEAAAESLLLAEKISEEHKFSETFVAIEKLSSIILPKELHIPDYSMISSIANHRTDTWNMFTLPFSISSFDVTCSYIVIVPSKHWRHYPHFRIFDSLLNGLRGGGWSSLKYSADQIAVNDQGNLLWKIYKNIGYSSEESDDFSPFRSSWQIQADHAKIIQAVLTTKHCWYLTTTDICVQMNLPEMGILHLTDCPFKVKWITASDHAVWALTEKGTLISRTQIDEQICPMGSDWVEDSLAGPTRFVSVALHEKTGFGLDFDGNLWFVNGVDEKNPLGSGYWFQTCSPSIVSSSNIKQTHVNHWQLKVSSYGIFFSVGKQVLVSTQPITGHLIRKVVPKRLALHDNFSIISAGGMGGVFVCQPHSEVFVFDKETRNLTSIPHFDTEFSIVALSSTSQRLYVLDNCGVLSVRRGLESDLTPLGNYWDRLDTNQLESPICSVAVSSNSLWIVTANGNIYMTTEGLRLSNSPKFVQIEAPKLINDKIDQIRVSPSGKYIWIFSLTSGRCFARYGVDESSHQFKGLRWIDTPADIKVVDVAVGENVVWAISQCDRRLHRLKNLSQSNIVGIGWRTMSFCLRTISVDSAESRLWGIDLNNQLVVHQMDIYPRNCLAPKPLGNVFRNSSRADSGDSWTDIGGNGYSIFRDN